MIGVIVPIYKTEKYVAECIESILAQTYTNFRLILVDDGSPDNAGAICDEYATKDSRITVIHQENAGVTRARARGVEEAHDCEWITFVDSDDILPEDSLEYFNSVINKGTNIIIGQISRFRATTPLEARLKNKISYINVEDLRSHAVAGIDCSLCAKFINRKLFDSNTFNLPREVTVGEDTIANVRITFNNNKKGLISTKVVYHYRQHSESCMHTFKNSLKIEERFIDYLWRAVPDEQKERYYQSYIHKRIMSFELNFGQSVTKPSWHGSEFHRKLINDIRRYKYYRLFLERMLIYSDNASLRRSIIITKKIKNKLVRFCNSCKKKF